MAKFSDNEELNRLVEEARKLPPMTPEEKRAQAISFAYGNLRLSGIECTEEQLGEIYDRLHAEEKGGRDGE